MHLYVLVNYVDILKQAQRQKENTDKHTADNPDPSYTY